MVARYVWREAGSRLAVMLVAPSRLANAAAPVPERLAIAPELGVLVALDATLATAAYQLLAEHPELGLEAMARGDLPSAEARGARHLVFRFCDLRAAIRSYHAVAIGEIDGDQLNPPF